MRKEEVYISRKELYVLLFFVIVMFWLMHRLVIILFLTFIFAYSANSTLGFFARSTLIRHYHKLFTFLLFVLFIILMIILGIFIIPSSYKDTIALFQHIPSSLHVMDFIKNDILEQIPLLNQIDDQTINNFLVAQGLDKINIPDVTEKITAFFGIIVTIFTYILVSFILAFFIVLEKKELHQFLKDIEKGPLGRYYLWIKPYMIVLADSFGKTFESQAVIALINSFLTIMGLYLFDFPYLLAIWFIVFIFSFVPVFGVMVSSIPIMILGFIIGGFPMVFKVLLLIIVIHFIEAYFLNPHIYASRAKLPITLAFAALVIGEFVGGVWGLLFAIPTLYFLYNILVLGKVNWNIKS